MEHDHGILNFESYKGKEHDHEQQNFNLTVGNIQNNFQQKLLNGKE